jgi:hypothetical protein
VTMSNGKVLHYIPDADMRNCHQGLALLAKKHLKINVTDLKPGEFVLFVNSSWTAIKIFGSDHCYMHYKRPDGARLNAKAVLSLPHFVRGQNINYDKALATVIQQDYGSRYDE